MEGFGEGVDGFIELGWAAAGDLHGEADFAGVILVAGEAEVGEGGAGLHALDHADDHFLHGFASLQPFAGFLGAFAFAVDGLGFGGEVRLFTAGGGFRRAPRIAGFEVQFELPEEEGGEPESGGAAEVEADREEPQDGGQRAPDVGTFRFQVVAEAFG